MTRLSSTSAVLGFFIKPVRRPNTMDYTPATTALITSDCEAIRSPSIKWP